MKRVVLKPGESFTCQCGKEHKLPGYVSAHWDTVLTHTCDCGAERMIRRGVVRLVERKSRIVAERKYCG